MASFAKGHYALKIFLITIFLVFLSKQFGFASAQEKYPLETKYIEVPLDHFEASAVRRTFKLRYLVCRNYYLKGGPVFVYIGNEQDILVHANNVGFIFDTAASFNALLVFVEHRYYGESLPFGNGSFASLDTLKYLSTSQALADFATVIDNLRVNYFDNSKYPSKTYPIITIGGSYGGILATWLRMKYPFLVLGSISSSAPYFYTPGLTRCDALYEKVTAIFEKSGRQQCIKTIKLGWDVIINLAKSKIGMEFLSSTWGLCKPLKDNEDLDKLLDWLSNVFVKMASVNYHYPSEFYTTLPAYPVKVFCDKLTTQYFNDTKGYVEAFGEALQIYTNYTSTKICNNINSNNDNFAEYAWDYQTCTEMIRPICSVESDMFMTKAWDYDAFKAFCYNKFGINYNPDSIDLVYGGINFRYYTNMLFTNALMDPLSEAGFYMNISDSVTYINITDAPFLMDFRKTDPSDNNYVLEAREDIVETIEDWLKLV